MHNHLPAFFCRLLPCKQQLVPCSSQIPENSSLKDSQIGMSLVRLYKQFRATNQHTQAFQQHGFSVMTKTEWNAWQSLDHNVIFSLTIWINVMHNSTPCTGLLHLYLISTEVCDTLIQGGFGRAPTPSPPYAARSSEDYLLTHWKIPLATGRKPLA